MTTGRLPQWQSRPARARVAVMFSADDAAYPVAECIARDILDAETGFDVVICVDRPDVPPSRWRDGPVRYVVISPDPRIDALPVTRAITRSTYTRLLLPEQLGADYDRILYLDSDIRVMRPALARLLAADMKGCAVAAAPDFTAYRDPPSDPHAAYRNAGILLLNCAGGRAAGAFERVIHHAATHPDALPQHDQSAINAALAGEMALLSPAWNFMHLRETVDLLPRVDPAILHFVGADKPWVPNANPARMAHHAHFAAALSRLFSGAELAAYGLWGTETGGKRKYAIPLAERLSRWNRRRNLARKARRAGPVVPLPMTNIDPFLTMADIP